MSRAKIKKLVAAGAFKSLSGMPRKQEFMLHLSWSGLDDGGDDGRGHLLRRGQITCDLGLDAVPDPPPTDEEMQKVAFSAKMALLKALANRKRGKR